MAKKSGLRHWKVKFTRRGMEPPRPFGKTTAVVCAESREAAKELVPASPHYPITVSATTDPVSFTYHCHHTAEIPAAHATKKSAAQLEREIGEVLSKPRSRGKQVAQAARQASEQLADLVHNRYFTSIPLDDIFGIVERAGFHFDPEEKQCILTGRDGRATWDLYWEPGQLVDHRLILTWHKMDVTGRYELVPYIS